MPEQVILALIGLGGTAIGVLFSFLGTWLQTRLRRWEMAGQVDRTDASTLWSSVMQLVQQATQLVHTLADRTVVLTKEVSELVVQVRTALADLQGDIMQARDMFATLRQLIADLEVAIESQRKATEDIRATKDLFQKLIDRYNTSASSNGEYTP
jgi:septal ring factor EnvC (AmiA/AmiB activator)